MRHQAIKDLRLTQLKAKAKKQCSFEALMEIDSSMLSDPINGRSEDMYPGRGSFGVVKVEVLHEILVAVKEYLPKTLESDLVHEASILNKMCHPYLPLLIGICTSQKPLHIIMRFHAFDRLQSKTMHMELT